jgi:hypothetical protein
VSIRCALPLNTNLFIGDPVSLILSLGAADANLMKFEYLEMNKLALPSRFDFESLGSSLRVLSNELKL